MLNPKKYMYCIISADGPQIFNIPGMAGADLAYTVNYKDLAVVVSDSCKERFTINRENMLAHQRVLEEVMRSFTLLPIRFGTLAESEENIQTAVLKRRYQEFEQMLGHFKDKNQVGLKVMWTDLPAVFQELSEANPRIKKLREAARVGRVESRNKLIEIGRYVEQELARKKEHERERIVTALKRLAHKTKIKDNYGDEMLVNANFLVEQSRQELFDAQVSQLAEMYGPKAHFKYVGPIPPYDFVQIFIE